MPAGRPTDYTTELASLICERIADGETLTAICREDGMPSRMTVWRWSEANAEFRDAYARAKQARLDHMAEEIIEISDDDTFDMKSTEGGLVVYHEHIQRSKLRVDTRKWLLAKLAANRYGDKVDLNHSGGVTVTIAATDANL